MSVKIQVEVLWVVM